MPRLLLATALAALTLIAWTASAQADCPGCQPNTPTPVTSIVTAPADPTGDSTPEYTFGSSESFSYYRCRWGASATEAWDDATAFDCPKNYTSPAKAAGTYHLAVKACKDYETPDIPITKCDATPARDSFTIDLSGPTARFAATSTFDNLRTNKAPKYDLEGGSAYQCSLDSVQLYACTSPYQINPQGGLGQGEHLVRVRAADQWGNWGPVVTRKFTWDNQGPDFTIGGPTITNDTTPELTWTAPPDGGGAYDVTCAVDEITIPCANGKAQVTTALADGDHAFRVSGTDSLGNTASTSRGLTIDTVAPEVRDLAWDATAKTLSFTTSEFAQTFCHEGVQFLFCTSPWAPEGLTPGDHELIVRAVDAADNVGTARITVTIPAPQKDPGQEQPAPSSDGGQQQQTPPPSRGATPPAPVVTPAPVTAPRTTAASTTSTKKPVAKKKKATKKKKCKTVKAKKGKRTRKVCASAKRKAKRKAKR